MFTLPISHHQQRQQADCLAACAAMLLDYLQVLVKYKALIRRLRIGYAGAPFRNLRYLDKFGVSVRIASGNIREPPILILSPKTETKLFVTLSSW